MNAFNRRLTWVGLLALIASAVSLIFNALGLISLASTVVNALEIAIGASSGIVAYDQWRRIVAPSAHSSSGDDLRSLRKEAEDNPNRLPGKGTVIVVTFDHEVGHKIKLVRQSVWVASSGGCQPSEKEVRRRRIGTGYLCIVRYSNVDPDDYAIWSDAHYPPDTIPVFANDVIILDWRY